MEKLYKRFLAFIIVPVTQYDVPDQLALLTDAFLCNIIL